MFRGNADRSERSRRWCDACGYVYFVDHTITEETNCPQCGRAIVALETWRVDLSRDPIDDAALRDRLPAKGLQELYLDHTHITDASAFVIARHQELEVLELGHTRVGDATLQQLNGLRGLQMLGLEGTSITDEGLRSLNSLHRLWCLDLERTSVGDAGIESLDLRALELLYLSHTRVTDHIFDWLWQLEKLEELWLVGTAVTSWGCDAIRAKLSNCVIER